MLDVVHAPLWLVALTAAVAAPFCVAAYQAALESRLRRTTQAVLARAATAAGGMEGTLPGDVPRAARPGDPRGELAGVARDTPADPAQR